MASTTSKKSPASEAAQAAESAFEAFKVNMPSMEVPQVFREAAEKTVSQARDAYARLKSVAVVSSDAIDEN
jgi:hypothetical protein